MSKTSSIKLMVHFPLSILFYTKHLILDPFLTPTQIWSVFSSEDQHTKIEFLANLSRHTKAVNVVKFSPKGELSQTLIFLYWFSMRMSWWLIRTFIFVSMLLPWICLDIRGEISKLWILFRQIHVSRFIARAQNIYQKLIFWTHRILRFFSQSDLMS